MIAGTQHGGGPGTDPQPRPLRQPAQPAQRHARRCARCFVALEEWVTRRAPRRRRQPRAVDRRRHRGRGRSSRDAGGARFRDCRRAPTASGRRSIGSIRRPGSTISTARASAAVDADGNEIAGIRLPPIAVPLGTYTGWNVYRAQPCELCDRDGSLIPFARTRDRARGCRRPAPLARRALRQPRGLCRTGPAGGGDARRRTIAAAGRRRGLCPKSRELRSVLTGCGAAARPAPGLIK